MLLVVVVLGVIIFGSQFANTANFANLAVASSFLAIISIGMTFVILSGGIDLSVGSMYALAAVLAAYSSRWGSLAGIVVPIVTCGALGLVQGTLIGKLRMPAFIVTLAGLLFARGLAFKVSDNGNKTHLIDRGRWMTNLGQERVLGVGAPVWIALALFGAGLVVLNRARLGQAVRDRRIEDAAVLMGLPVAQVKIVLYDDRRLSGLAGMLVAARSSSGLSTSGSGLELEAIAAVVIGGTLLTGGAGGLTGTMIGVLLLGVIQNLINQVRDVALVPPAGGQRSVPHRGRNSADDRQQEGADVTSERLRVAVVGTGEWWGREHARVFSQRPDVELCAIVGRSSDKTMQRAAEFGTKPYVDLDEMLATETPDLVSLCLPNESHFDTTLHAIEAGFPLLVEKPLVFNSRRPTAYCRSRRSPPVLRHQLQPPLCPPGADGPRGHRRTASGHLVRHVAIRWRGRHQH